MAFGLVSVAGTASADEPATGTVNGTATTPAVTTPAVTTPTVASTAKKDETPKPSGPDTPDHELFERRFGIAFHGISQTPIAAPAGATVGVGSVTTPVVGVRYWLSKGIGIDGGIGLGFAGGSTTVKAANGTETKTDKADALGFMFHAGVPIVPAYAKHYKFLVIPEINIGGATQTIKGGTPAVPSETKLSGFYFDIGARAGAEIHFGFIGVPELSLQGTVGLALQRQSVSATTTVAGAESSVSDGTTRIGTSLQAPPWAIFTNNIAAIYYFP
jgi:hypothetical protein